MIVRRIRLERGVSPSRSCDGGRILLRLVGTVAARRHTGGSERPSKPASSRRARWRTGRRRPRPALRAVPHQGRRSGRRGRACRWTAPQVGKSDRLTAGAWLEVDLPDADRPLRSRGRARCPACGSCYDDDHLVVVDKPVGVAAHPSPGWTGPTVHRRPGRRRASAISTSGAAERQGDRAPPRRRHERADGGRQVRTRVHAAQARVQGARGREDLPRAGPGPPRPEPRHRRRPDRPPPDARLEVGDRRRAAGRASPTTRRSRRTAPRACCGSGWRPAAPTRSACTWRRCATRASATPPTAPTPPCRRGWAWNGSGCTPSLGFEHPDSGERVCSPVDYPDDLARALADVSAES